MDAFFPRYIMQILFCVILFYFIHKAKIEPQHLKLYAVLKTLNGQILASILYHHHHQHHRRQPTPLSNETFRKFPHCLELLMLFTSSNTFSVAKIYFPLLFWCDNPQKKYECAECLCFFILFFKTHISTYFSLLVQFNRNKKKRQRNTQFFFSLLQWNYVNFIYCTKCVLMYTI